MPLPEPRDDGLCADCGQKPAVTGDGRFCLKCLRALCRQLSPGAVTPGGFGRGRDQRQAGDREPSPWQENNIRHLEGD
jgi:hypothetical protein